MNTRASGILMHISSLPSRYGIGDFGTNAYAFVDTLEASKTKYWQVLPMGITSYGDSPYQSFSAFAGNPYFIDFDAFISAGYLTEVDIEQADLGSDPLNVDYEKLYFNKYPLLRKAYRNAHDDLKPQLSKFLCTHDWVDDFSLFMAIKDHFDGVSWQEWPEEYKSRDKKTLASFKDTHQNDIYFWVFTQYFFFNQWHRLKTYANTKGIEIIGDIPIYVAIDCADVWVNPHHYKLDKNLVPITVAGVPPDLMSEEGQLWGNPIYDWETHDKEQYAWWIKRIEESFLLYDSVRIDHFRGFEAYWEVPFGADNAITGRWVKGPGMKLFTAINEAIGEKDILAEDLGFITREVHELIQATGYPGMKILQFGFGGDNAEFAPHNIQYNAIAYTSNHDTMTMAGWLLHAGVDEIRRARQYLNLTTKEGYTRGFIRSSYMSHAYLAIVPLQDWLNLNNSARMNEPSTLGGNWMWRVDAASLTDELTQTIKEMNMLFGRAL